MQGPVQVRFAKNLITEVYIFGILVTWEQKDLVDRLLTEY